MATSLITSSKFKNHDTGEGFPESPKRLDAITDHLKSTGLIKKLDIVEPNRSTKSICGLVHNEDYITRVRRACKMGAPIIDTADNPISKSSYDTALLAIGGITKAVDIVLSGNNKNAMVLLRPPGHHAEKDRAMGFCLFNNIAVAVKYVQQNHKVEKVVIIDFDVHHGNGTQHIFEEDPSVMFISLHQFPFYPGTGAIDEVGIGKGKGTTVNYPLKMGAGDKEFLDIFENSLTDKVLKYNPDIILISAGFDAHVNDPIGGLNITIDGFNQISNIIKNLATETCGGKIVSSLEGGYNLAALAESVEAHLLALQGIKT